MIFSTNMLKSILTQSPLSAKRFFLGQEAYSNIDLPSYYTFDCVLREIDRVFTQKELNESDLKRAKKSESINHVLYGNKDGKYAWRKYEILNPLIYVSLVNIITEQNNWNFLKKRFKEFQNDNNIECESVPILPRNGSKQKATQISQWINNVEKKSIALSLEYRFLYQTDISDCYGSIYSHSLPWAIHTKETSKNNRMYGDLFGNKIDHHIQAMAYGQTNGIPQGSILMDFLAEIILGYVDSELSKKINIQLNGKQFHILRYRDDYRIFVNDVSDGDIVLKCLSEELLSLGLRLNTSKTSSCDDVIGGSVKKDKLDALNIEEVPKKLTNKELLRQLLIVQQFGKKFPNSGTIKRRLANILDAVKSKDFTAQEKIIASLLTDIAYDSPDSFPTVASLISKCIEKLNPIQKKELLLIVQKKICMLSNVGLLEIWTQRIALGLKFKLNLREKLCTYIYDSSQKIFETGWINISNVKAIIDNHGYVDMRKANNVKPVISNKEVQIFGHTYE